MVHLCHMLSVKVVYFNVPREELPLVLHYCPLGLKAGKRLWSTQLMVAVKRRRYLIPLTSQNAKTSPRKTRNKEDNAPSLDLLFFHKSDFDLLIHLLILKKSSNL
ncbi:hypothetical protein L1887_15538 [Cichorium endivia]|nr:hypothetical protein L1887_15538 [Cichorium endivia]